MSVEGDVALVGEDEDREETMEELVAAAAREVCESGVGVISLRLELVVSQGNIHLKLEVVSSAELMAEETAENPSVAMLVASSRIPETEDAASLKSVFSVGMASFWCTRT